MTGLYSPLAEARAEARAALRRYNATWRKWPLNDPKHWRRVDPALAELNAANARVAELEAVQVAATLRLGSGVYGRFGA